jgi:hypothetical protein
VVVADGPFPARFLPRDGVDALGVRLSPLRIARPRQGVACRLTMHARSRVEVDA